MACCCTQVVPADWKMLTFSSTLIVQCWFARDMQIRLHAHMLGVSEILLHILAPTSIIVKSTSICLSGNVQFRREQQVSTIVQSSTDCPIETSREYTQLACEHFLLRSLSSQARLYGLHRTVLILLLGSLLLKPGSARVYNCVINVVVFLE